MLQLPAKVARHVCISKLDQHRIISRLGDVSRVDLIILYDTARRLLSSTSGNDEFSVPDAVTSALTR